MLMIDLHILKSNLQDALFSLHVWCKQKRDVAKYGENENYDVNNPAEKTTY